MMSIPCGKRGPGWVGGAVAVVALGGRAVLVLAIAIARVVGSQIYDTLVAAHVGGHVLVVMRQVYRGGVALRALH